MKVGKEHTKDACNMQNETEVKRFGSKTQKNKGCKQECQKAMLALHAFPKSQDCKYYS